MPIWSLRGKDQLIGNCRQLFGPIGIPHWVGKKDTVLLLEQSSVPVWGLLLEEKSVFLAETKMVVAKQALQQLPQTFHS